MRTDLLKVGGIALLSLFVFWLPFLLKIGSFWGINFAQQGMNTIVQNFDGLNFLVVAKSWYNPNVIDQINKQFLTGNEPIYFTAHYPLFALLIGLFKIFVPAPHALILAIIISNVLLAISLYYVFKTTIKDHNVAYILTLICLFFPARMLSTRAVGSNEPLFIALVGGSLALNTKGKYWLSAIMGSLAVLTRAPGIILFGGYLLSAIASYKTDFSRIVKTLFPYLLMPLTLLCLFAFYGATYGDPLAYFKSGDNIHFFFPPFQIFGTMQSWISGMWREDFIYIYLMYGLGLFAYGKKLGATCGFNKLSSLAFGTLYGVMLLFVSHQDLARYALPIFPIAIMGFAPWLPKKIPGWAVLLMLIPVYLLGWQFVVQNVQPINDWRAIL